VLEEELVARSEVLTGFVLIEHCDLGFESRLGFGCLSAVLTGTLPAILPIV
jgi:hypothetical protein